MIESPIHHVADIRYLLNQGNLSSYRNSLNEKLVVEKTRELVHGNAVIFYFIRMSWLHKLKFLKDLSEKIKKVNSISLILNTLYCVSGKVASYSKTTTKKPILYDTILEDHDRMLSEKSLEEIIKRDLVWYESISDDDQIALFIAMMRISGGAIIDTMYKHLQEVYYKKNREMSEEKPDSVKQEKECKEIDVNRNESFNFVANEHDPNNLKHQECLRITKKWDEMIDEYRKEIEKATPKKKVEKNGSKKDNKKSKKKDKKKGGGKKSKSPKDDTDKNAIDWIQIMPIFTVKKIFSYLDKNTLTKAKKVNEYWKWVITDMGKEEKVKKLLEKTIKQIKTTVRVPKHDQESKPMKKDLSEKRMEKLFRRGAIVEKLRYITTTPVTQDCLIINSFQVAPYNVSYLEDITMYPRVVRANSALYKKPTITCKDYNMICKNSASTISSDDDFVTPVFTSEYSTISSDEIEF